MAHGMNCTFVLIGSRCTKNLWQGNDVADQDMLTMTREAIQFITAFYDIITAAALHVYISALPLVSPETLLYKTYTAESIAERPWVVSRVVVRSHILSGHQGCINSVAFAPDGSKIVTGSDDKTIRIWDVRGIPVGEPIRSETAVIVAVFSPDGWRVASLSRDRMVRQWDVRTGTNFGKPLPAYHPAVAYSPDGYHIATALLDGKIYIWEATTGTAIHQLDGPWFVVVHVVFSPNGKQIASATNDHTIRIWDAETGLVVGEPVPNNVKYGILVAWSPNGSHLAMTSEFVVRLLDVQTRQVIFHLQHIGVRDLAFSPDGSKLATVSALNNGSLRSWDVSTSAGKSGSHHPVQTFKLQGYTPEWQTSVSFSPSGLALAGISWDRRTVCTWREALTFTPCPKPSSDFASYPTNHPSLSMHPNSTDQTLLYRDVVSDDGWVRTAAGQRVIWVPYAGDTVTVDSDSLTIVPPYDVPTSE